MTGLRECLGACPGDGLPEGQLLDFNDLHCYPGAEPGVQALAVGTCLPAYKTESGGWCGESVCARCACVCVRLCLRVRCVSAP